MFEKNQFKKPQLDAKHLLPKNTVHSLQTVFRMYLDSNAIEGNTLKINGNVRTSRLLLN